MSDIQKTQRELKERITKGLNHGIEALEEVLDATTDLYNQFVLLKSKYNDLMHFSAINVMPYTELELGFDRLRSNLIKLVDELDDAELKKSNLEQDLQNTAQPMLRANFFQLLEIHYKNLDAISYEESFYNENTRTYDAKRVNGREAMFKIFASLRRNYNRKDGTADKEALKAYFVDYFTHEIGLLEVYIHNVKHLLQYIEKMEVDRVFFETAFRSALSRFEIAILFYFAFSEMDPKFNACCRKAKLFEEELLKRTLIAPEHFDWLQVAS